MAGDKTLATDAYIKEAVAEERREEEGEIDTALLDSILPVPTPRSWEVEVTTRTTGGVTAWFKTGRRFATREGAEEFARRLDDNWVFVWQTRVAESCEEPNR